ncbi:hypothetical protein DFH27DRAFT_520786 [Peziza echinospora]|nr:hypothetical protein DFH27DRAFT_520786 [Peziza echinospora]
MYTGLEGSYMNDEAMYNQSIFMDNYLTPSTLSQMPTQSYPIRHSNNEVKIAQQEESLFGFSGGDMYGGMWGGEVERIENSKPFDLRYRTQDSAFPESFPRPLLSLSTCFDQSTYLHNQTYLPNSACSSYPSTDSDMGAYSNESSPLINSQYSTAPHSPITPVTTPLLSGQVYTAPGMNGAFVLVPVVAQDALGNFTTVFVPKQAPMATYMDNAIQSQLDYCPEMDYNLQLQYMQEQAQFNYLEETQSQGEVEQDDGPELVGMGLYDDPPELLFSASNTPELSALCTPEFTGRSLVLEQSFTLPEEDDEDEEYEDEEEDDQESEDEDDNEMTY